MVKRLYLSKNEFTGQYFLDGGSFGEHREYLGIQLGLIMPYLKENIVLKRKTEFHVLKENMDEGLLKDIEKYFSGSKVKVSLENSFD